MFNQKKIIEITNNLIHSQITLPYCSIRQGYCKIREGYFQIRQGYWRKANQCFNIAYFIYNHRIGRNQKTSLNLRKYINNQLFTYNIYTIIIFFSFPPYL